VIVYVSIDRIDFKNILLSCQVNIDGTWRIFIARHISIKNTKLLFSQLHVC